MRDHPHLLYECVAVCCSVLQCVAVERYVSWDSERETWLYGVLVYQESCLSTATHCNTLQHTATHCNTPQRTATHSLRCAGISRVLSLYCNTLQYTATHCNTLQHVATHCNKLSPVCWYITSLISLLQHTATHCNTLPHTATHSLRCAGISRVLSLYCNTLQYTATHCNTLQHTPSGVLVYHESYLSIWFFKNPPVIFKHPSKNIQNPYSWSQNSHLTPKTPIYPLKKTCPPGSNCVSYYHTCQHILKTHPNNLMSLWWGTLETWGGYD